MGSCIVWRASVGWKAVFVGLRIVILRSVVFFAGTSGTEADFCGGARDCGVPDRFYFPEQSRYSAGTSLITGSISRTISWTGFYERKAFFLPESMVQQNSRSLPIIEMTFPLIVLIYFSLI